MKTPTTLFCSLILLELGRCAFGCPCSDDCGLPAENSCPEGRRPLCEQKSDICACTCSSEWYSLSIDINSAAAAKLEDSSYDLAVFKGYMAGGSAESFDTAWYVVENSALVESKIDLKWAPSSKAGFVDKVEESNVILKRDTLISDEFEGGVRMVFDGEGWSGPSQSGTVVAPEFEVEYKPVDNPMHLTLLAPVIVNDAEEWTPYFYDENAMDQDAVTRGYPSTTLYVQLTRNIEAGTFTGVVNKEALKIDYEDNAAMTICILTSTTENLEVQLGSCGGADKMKMGVGDAIQ